MKTVPFFCLLALLAGCQTENINSVERAQPQAQANYVPDKRIVTSNSLDGAVQLGVVNQTTVGNLLQVQIQLENMRNSSLGVRYLVEWYNQQGMLINSPAPVWQPKNLQPREITSIQAVAPMPTAVDFVIKFQRF